MKWTEAISDFARHVVGSITIPFPYVIRNTVNVPAVTLIPSVVLDVALFGWDCRYDVSSTFNAAVEERGVTIDADADADN